LFESNVTMKAIVSDFAAVENSVSIQTS